MSDDKKRQPEPKPAPDPKPDPQPAPPNPDRNTIIETAQPEPKETSKPN